MTSSTQQPVLDHLVKVAVMTAVCLAIGCSKAPEVLLDTPENFPTHFKEVSRGEWPPKGYSKVVGYRFDFPETIYSADILYTDDQRTKREWVNEEKLSKLTAVKKELDSSSVERLLKCTFSEQGNTGRGACYQPHHIFLFYSPEGKITNAIEVCFGCKNALIAPAPSEGYHRSVDLAATAKLCDELGLWFNDLTMEQYLADLKYREDRNNETQL